jgi:hypothetical protein
MHPGMTQPERGPHLRDRTTRRPLRPRIAERAELLMSLVGANLAVRGNNPFLDLVHKRVRDPAPIRGLGNRFARIPGPNMPSNRVMRTASQLGCSTQRPGQIVGSKDFHDFLSQTSFGPLPGQLGAI